VAGILDQPSARLCRDSREAWLNDSRVSAIKVNCDLGNSQILGSKEVPMMARMNKELINSRELT